MQLFNVKPFLKKSIIIVKSTKRYWLSVFFVIVVFLLTVIFSHNHQLTEDLYSKNIYPIIAAVIGFVSDLVPFSIHEVVIIVLIGAVICRIFYGIFKVIKRQIAFKAVIKNAIHKTILFLSIVYCSFYLFGGFNYFRVSLFDSKDYHPEKITPKRFDVLLNKTISQLNRLSKHKMLADSIIDSEIEKQLADTIYSHTGQRIRSAQRVKSFFTGYIEVSGIAGMVLLFFHEVHLARNLSPIHKPFFLAHERAHIKGRLNEAEANYFAYKACTNSKLPLVQYSGHYEILKYMLGTLSAQKQKKWIKKLDPIVVGHIVKDQSQSKTVNQTINSFSRRFNDAQLTVNKVEGGNSNYCYVIRLLLGLENSNNSL